MKNIGKKLLSENSLPDFGRIALVKQDVHNDLYYRDSPATAKEIIYSSILRSGPVGLFTALDADFIVVKNDPSLECNIWKQKAHDCKHNPEEYYIKFQNCVSRNGKTYDHAPIAKNVDSVDWSKYDIVISIDIAIPTRVIKKYSRIIWAYYISEPCMSFYRESLKAPQFGYDIVLSLGFQRERPLFTSLSILEFPYFLQYVGCFEDLDGVQNLKYEDRNLIAIENHSRKIISTDQISEISKYGQPSGSSGELQKLITSLRYSKYLLRFDAKAIWGNSQIEGAVLGALLIGSPSRLKHRLILEELRGDSFEEIISLINRIEADADFRTFCIKRQAELTNYLCFIRPLKDLALAISNIK
jgi:hypothetical protein